MTKQEAQDQADMMSKAIDEILRCGGTIGENYYDTKEQRVNVSYIEGDEVLYVSSVIKNNVPF